MKKKKESTECLACHNTGKVSSPLLYLMAFKSDVKRCENIPEGAKTLALNLIGNLLPILYKIPGKLELSYRRGIQEGLERKLRR